MKFIGRGTEMAAKRKSSILIPHSLVNGSVPHYLDTWAVRNVPTWKAALAAGEYDLMPYWWKGTQEEWNTHERDRLIERISSYEFEWREPAEFDETFEITGYYRGRSAAGFELKSESTGGDCCMMMKDISTMIPQVTITNGKVTGRWIYKKRGANYGVEYVGPVTTD